MTSSQVLDRKRAGLPFTDATSGDVPGKGMGVLRATPVLDRCGGAESEYGEATDLAGDPVGEARQFLGSATSAGTPRPASPA